MTFTCQCSECQDRHRLLSELAGYAEASAALAALDEEDE